ncbi:MAG: hypothetical protein ABIP48_12770 [Planctomycetota bacterium]
MKKTTVWHTAGFTLVALTLLRPVETSGQQTANHELRAVPVPQEVTLDGKLDEWDLSGEILMCYDVETLLDRHSVRAAAMYDKDGLYLSFRFMDPSPLVNHVDPDRKPSEGWKADAVQLRIWTDPEKPIGPPDGGRITHLDCYWYTDAEKPAAHVVFGRVGPGTTAADHEGKIERAIGKGVDAAFLKDTEGTGYTHEMRVSWKLLRRDGQPYAAGESFRMGIETFWGDATGREMCGFRMADLLNAEHPHRDFFWANHRAWGTLRLMEKGNIAPSESVKLVSRVDELRRLRYNTEGPVPLDYEIPADGYVTLVIETLTGQRVRNLISNYPRPAGKNTDFWDGTDDSGRLVSPGSYQVRGLYHGELDALFEFYYASPGNPPWPTADTTGCWLANHTNPMDVLADDERVYVTAGHAEGPHALLALDYEGNKVWGGLSRWYGGFMARSAEYLYVLNDKDLRSARNRKSLEEEAVIELIRVDPKTGQMVPFPDGQSRHVVAKWNIQDEGAARKGGGWTIAHHAHDADWAATMSQGLAALDGRLYASMHFRDKLLVIDEKQGTVIDEIPLEKPAGLASDGKRLLAISGRAVVAVDTTTGEATPVVTAGLEAPVGLAVDKAANIYVSDWSDQMCVKVFSPAGERQGSVGKLGGRQAAGPYEPDGMFLPRGVSVDARGRVWVAENDFSPRRISCWNPDRSLAVEKLGGCYYAAYGCFVFPDQPNRAFSMGNLVELDWDKGRWRVLGTPWRSTHEDALLGLNHNSDISAVHQINGRRFIVHSGNGRGGFGGVTMISEWKDDRAVPLAAASACVEALGTIGQGWRGGIEPSPIFADHLWTDPRMNKAAREVVPWFFQGPRAGDSRALYAHQLEILKASSIRGVANQARLNNNFVWSDLNGNGRIDEDEIRYHATPGLSGPLPPEWRPEQWAHGVADENLALYFSAGHEGKYHHYRLPVSRWAESGAPMYDPDEAKLIVQTSYLGLGAWVSDRGELLTYGNVGNVKRNRLRDPLVMFKPDGSTAWTYPSDYSGVHGSHTAPMPKNGLLVGPLGVMGEAHLTGVGQLFAFHTNMGQAVLFTADGLFVGELFRDCRSGPESYPASPKRGVSIKNTSNGGEWFGGQMFQHPDTRHVYISACRSVPCLSKVTGLETLRRLPQTSLAFTRGAYDEAAELLAAREIDEQPKVLVIASLASDSEGPLTVDRFAWGKDRAAQWQFGAERTAEAAWAFDSRNLHVCFRNVADDTPMINGGEDPQRLFKYGDAALLEIRTIPDDKSRQILPGDLRLLFSVLKGKPVAVLYRYRVPGTADPVLFQSVKTTRIDEIEVLDDARITIERGPDSYTLSATVPLAALGFQPERGKSYRGDVGIVHSDKTGQVNELRMNWANTATGLVSDLSGEAEMTPALWGRFDVETAR